MIANKLKLSKENKKGTKRRTFYRLAERVGFEPTVHLLGVHTISNRAPSTTRTPLLLEVMEENNYGGEGRIRTHEGLGRP